MGKNSVATDPRKRVEIILPTGRSITLFEDGYYLGNMEHLLEYIQNLITELQSEEAWAQYYFKAYEETLKERDQIALRLALLEKNPQRD